MQPLVLADERRARSSRPAHRLLRQMVNEFGSGAAPSAHPVAVWVARFDAATLDLISFAPAPDSSANIVYGAAVESD